MTRTENTKRRIIITILLGCISVFLYYVALSRIQSWSFIYTVEKEMKDTAGYLEEAYPSVRESVEFANKADEEVYVESLNMLCKMSEVDPDFEISDVYLEDLGSVVQEGDVMITDRKGKVLASAQGNHLDLSGEAGNFVYRAFKSDNPVIERTVYEDPETGSSSLTLWCVRAFDKEHAFVLRVDNLMELASMLMQNGWSGLLGNREIGQEGFVFVWLDKTGELLYYPSSEQSRKNIDAIGLDMADVRDGEYGWFRIDGSQMYLYTTFYEKEGVWIACAIPQKSLKNPRTFTLTVFSIVFALLTVVIVYYVILLLKQKKIKVLRDFTGTEKKTVHKSRQYKLLVLTCVTVVLLFVFQYYLLTLYLMSTWSETASRQIELIEQEDASWKDSASVYVEFYETEKNQQLSTLASFLADRPKLCTSAVLDEFSYVVGASDIRILDSEGKARVATSSMASSIVPDYTDSEESDDPVQMVAKQDKGKEIREWMSEGRSVLLPMEGKNASLSGYMYVRYYSWAVDSLLKSFSLNSTLFRNQPGCDGIIFAVDMDTNAFAYYPDDSLIGKDALQYGLTKDQIRDNFRDYITINGTTYYTVTDELGSTLIYYAISKSRLVSERTQLCILATLAAAVLFLFTGLALFTSRQQVEVVPPEEERHTLVEDRNSPENRTLRILAWYLVAAAALIAIYSAFRRNTGTGGVIGYVLDGRWERSFNVFAMFASAIILSQGGIILFIFSKIVKAVGDILPVREGTILKVAGSLVTYLAIAFLIYRCMICFGLNPTALMASAGIVSVVLGIGANSLVGDILAGLFLLMEGNVQVGDVVQIGDFRGYVIEMGIRMTKLFDMDMDDVKIIPNNEVRNVVHMTMHVSIVYSDFQIRYEEKLENVEKILRQELKHVKDKSPLILEGPIYIGVNMLDSNGVVLRTKTKCHEPCRRRVEREVNHIVYSIFQKHNISVPYPQVTVHEGDDETVER